MAAGTRFSQKLASFDLSNRTFRNVPIAPRSHPAITGGVRSASRDASPWVDEANRQSLDDDRYGGRQGHWHGEGDADSRSDSC